MSTKHLRSMFVLMTAMMLILVACKKKQQPTSNTNRNTTARNTPPDANKPGQQTANKPGQQTANQARTTAQDASGNIVGKEITYKAGDTTLKGYIAYDKSKEGKRPGVIVVHEWWGHNDYARRRARMLAELGYVALALDMYGEGKQASHPKEAGKFAQAVMKNMEEGEKRFKAAKQALEKHPMTNADKIAAIGYCFGGAIVLHMARVGLDLDGVVSFHGNLRSPHKAKKGEIKAEVLVLNGAADPLVKKEDIKSFVKEMKKAGAEFKVISYPGAKHAFTNPSATENGKKYNLPLAYDKEADEKSWEAMKQFLGRVFKEG